MTAKLSDLAIAPLLPEIGTTLQSSTRLVLEAPPGAGKTTGVPLALLDCEWLRSRSILVLEPRRIAARAAAARMASLLGETPGDTVGYRTRLDSRVGPNTRIEVVTEGILTRHIQNDPELAGVGAVLFDEFHERNLTADLGLALALDSAKALRPDLRIVVMSATLDGQSVARLLNSAPVLRAEGRTFPVETRHLPAPITGKLVPGVVAAVKRALSETDGDMLVFLPGEREIRSAERALIEDVPDAFVVPLYGALAPAAQDRVFAPAPDGARKIVLSTSIAETSLTIDGIRVVVDSGFAREPRFDPATGMTHLETVRVSQASADQRRGRAGRTAPGVCYRLWPEAATKGLTPRATPEILQADLAPLALELAQWGTNDPSTLAWLDPPPAAAYGEATELLRELEALDANGHLTTHGRAMARLPLHPRLAHMTIMARDLGLVYEASLLAALLTERDILAGPAAIRDADVRLRIDVLHRASTAVPPGMSVRDSGRKRALAAARQIRGVLRADEPTHTPRIEELGLLVALAYPDRIAQQRGSSYRLANGRGAALPDGDPLAREPWLAVAEVGGGDKDGRIFLAAPLTRDEIDKHFAQEIANVDTVEWNARTESVEARRQRRLGALALDDSHWRDAPPDRIAAALLDGVRALGLNALSWSDAARQLRTRVTFLRSLDGTDGDWPDLSDTTLLASLDDWLLPYLAGKRNRRDLESLDLTSILGDRLSWEQRRRLDAEAPRLIRMPSGREVILEYGGDVPVLAARLQDFFGMADTPRIGGGRVPLSLHLLSPAGRPVQVTRDLAGFWKGSYAEVRKDMRGRYPKHRWPEDPATAEPLAPRPRR
ncbi:MAG TPA: ATP-dependent helicase HrpB [Alphaproteobacteria bacterium]|nr:ATP-dependent helicase HrpB [Alphaproteobacteria bacterium]